LATDGTPCPSAPCGRCNEAPHIKSDGEQADCARLRTHLNRYTARNTFDYFIHKDLRSFLRRDLDFFTKNEVMQLDDIESETVQRVEQYLSKIKVIRRIAAKIIDFLAQIEDFQKNSGSRRSSWLRRAGACGWGAFRRTSTPKSWRTTPSRKSG